MIAQAGDDALVMRVNAIGLAEAAERAIVVAELFSQISSSEVWLDALAMINGDGLVYCDLGGIGVTHLQGVVREMEMGSG